MNNAQQIERQPEQQQGEAPAREPGEETFGLPRPLYAQLMQLTPADAEALSSMLQTYPRFNTAILQVAAGHMGNAAVQRAIAIANNGRSGVGSGETARGPLSNQEMHEFLDDPPARAQPARGPLSNREMHAFLDDSPARAQPARGPLSNQEMHAFLEDGPAQAQPAARAAAPSATPAAAEPAWVAGARAYNATHAAWVDEFNELTDYFCQVGGDGKVDPQEVARWQGHHGLVADGKIGPHTIAAARKLKAKAPEVAAAPQADARPPV